MTMSIYFSKLMYTMHSNLQYHARPELNAKSHISKTHSREPHRLEYKELIRVPPIFINCGIKATS
jgi:hypothetical protein